MNAFSFSRWWGIVIKEFIQLKRDRLTFGMIVGIPIMQLLLFGFAINNDPKGLPTAVIAAEQSEFSRSFVRGMENTGYLSLIGSANAPCTNHAAATYGLPRNPTASRTRARPTTSRSRSARRRAHERQ